jgi:hypothetical protein
LQVDNDLREVLDPGLDGVDRIRRLGGDWDRVALQSLNKHMHARWHAEIAPRGGVARLEGELSRWVTQIDALRLEEAGDRGFGRVHGAATVAVRTKVSRWIVPEFDSEADRTKGAGSPAAHSRANLGGGIDEVTRGNDMLPALAGDEDLETIAEALEDVELDASDLGFARELLLDGVVLAEGNGDEQGAREVPLARRKPLREIIKALFPPSRT